MFPLCSPIDGTRVVGPRGLCHMVRLIWTSSARSLGNSLRNVIRPKPHDTTLAGVLKKGGNYHAAAKLRAKAIAAGEPMRAGLIDSVVTSGMWTNARCHEAGYNIATTCQLCGAAEDSEAHRLWHCPAVCNSKLRDIVASNHLCVEARATAPDDPRPAHQRVPCLWLRGIIPSPWLETKVPENIKTASMGIFEQDDWNLHQKTVYLDESAGRYSSNPSLRRCGWGLYVMDDERCPSGAYSATLPGAQQSQIRACLEGILHIARRSTGGCDGQTRL